MIGPGGVSSARIRRTWQDGAQPADSDVVVHAEPVSRGRGALVVRIAWGPDTYSRPSDAWFDDCDGTIHRVRPRRVGP